jgi:crossover junction endodeoxyribonuclease RuvC
MIVLGIDPSFTATGYAVMQQHGQKQFLLTQGTVALPASKQMAERIAIFYNFIQALIVQFQVQRIALETPFLGKNAATFLKLGYLRGVLHLLAHQNNLQILEFAPMQVKKALTGFSGAQKDQVSRVVHMLFPNLTQQKSYDVTDAIAIGLCGLWQNS